LIDGRSLLEATLARIQPLVPTTRTFVIVTRHHLEVAHRQLAGLPADNVLVQPHNRDTGPGIVFSLLRLARRGRDAIVAVFPSDHYVGNGEAFRDHVARAAAVVRRFPQKIALLGIRPDRPDADYGYVAPARPLRGRHAGTTFHVSEFVEKPSPDIAARVVARGGLWNSFVMVFRLTRVLDLLQRLRPAACREIGQMDAQAGTGEARCEHVEPWNFSTEFLARVPEHLIVLRVDDVEWSDWGTRESIERTLASLNRVPPWATPTDTRAGCSAL
jgi:mannose-1-phosphate guanylyltransferase